MSAHFGRVNFGEKQLIAALKRTGLSEQPAAERSRQEGVTPAKMAAAEAEVNKGERENKADEEAGLITA